MAAAMLAQAPVTVDGVPAGNDRVDVAYEELAKGQANAAIEHILANTRIESDDPAALINLGAAYAMLGEKQKAADCYRSAIASTERYDLQLADGRWMDSRRVARMAAEALTRGETLALR
jgi:Tfp pilus assembly protein PilF